MRLVEGWARRGGGNRWGLVPGRRASLWERCLNGPMPGDFGCLHSVFLLSFFRLYARGDDGPLTMLRESEAGLHVADVVTPHARFRREDETSRRGGVWHRWNGLVPGDVWP